MLSHQRSLRCFSAQSGQRVWPSMALLGQDLQMPRSLRLRRRCAVRFRRRSLRSDGVSGTRFGCLSLGSLPNSLLSGFATAGAGLGVVDLLRLCLGLDFGEGFGM